MTGADLAGLTPTLILAAGGLTLLAAAILPRPLPDRALTLAAVAFLVAAGSAAGWLWDEPRAIAGLLRADPLARLFGVLLCAGGVGVVLLAHDHPPIRSDGRAELLALILFACLGALLLTASDHLLAAFLGLETLAVPLYALVAWRPRRPGAVEGGVKYALLAGFAAALVLYGVSLAYAAAGTMDLGPLAAAAGAGSLLPAAILLVVAGVAFKLAVVPFHMWAPDVYEAAPAPVTALLASVAKAAAVAFLVYLLMLRLPAVLEATRPLFWGLAAATMTAGNLLALRQENLKRLLAYSSVAHAGYILVAFAAGNELGREAAVYYAVAYLAMNLGAFGFVSALARADADRGRLETYRGAGRCYPLPGVGFGICLLALAGVPPTAGFSAKLLAFGAAVEADHAPLAVIAALHTALAFFYYLRVLRVVFARGDEAATGPAPGRAATAVVVAAGLATLLMGIFPQMVPGIAGG